MPLSTLGDRARLHVVRHRAATGAQGSPLVAGQALANLTQRAAAVPAVVLLVPTVRADAVFAGLRTAFEVAGSIGRRTGLPLRVLTLDAPSRPARAAARRRVSSVLGVPESDVEVRSAWEQTHTHRADVWIATYFSTAHALDRACDRGTVDRDRVVYLVQDHEPAFFPASTESVIAAHTYRCGFRLLVNSEPLRRFLVDHTDAQGIEQDRTFRPALDVTELHRAARARVSSPVVRIGFYARPEKPRNGFALGRAALQLAGPLLAADGIPYTVTTIGAAHRAFAVGSSQTAVAGRLAWTDAFTATSEIDVLLSLQLTPHPSHPPLDAVASGGIAVTNDVGGSRAGLSPRLRASGAAPTELAAALRDAARVSMTTSAPTGFDDTFLRRLGRPLEAALDATLRGLS